MTQKVKSHLSLMPWPESFRYNDGSFPLNPKVTIHMAQQNVPETATKNSSFLNLLKKILSPLNIAISLTEEASTADIVIKYDEITDIYPKPDANENYSLQITPSQIQLSAESDTGIFRALATLAQTISYTESSPPIQLPCLHIEDAPYLHYRGLLLDVSRHFITIPSIKKTIESMWLHKINALHLHLTDDQGFRFESKIYPKLTLPHEKSKQFYSQEELKELIHFAAEHGIRIIPEIDMPGHCASWLIGYPELAAHDIPESLPTELKPMHYTLNIASQSTLHFVKNLIEEVFSVFPDQYIHLGGDEVSDESLLKNDQIKQLVESNETTLQTLKHDFFRTIASFIASLDGTPLFWDEALCKDLPSSTIIQAWRGPYAKEHVCQYNYKTIVSSGYYLDWMYDASFHYAIDPKAIHSNTPPIELTAFDLPGTSHSHKSMQWFYEEFSLPKPKTQITDKTINDALLGATTCLWSEMVSEEILDRRLWSRLPALAERFWSQAVIAETDFFFQRIGQVRNVMQKVTSVSFDHGIRQWAEKITTNSSEQKLLLAFFNTLAPIKWYGRLKGVRKSENHPERHYDTKSPLDQIIDTLIPEDVSNFNFSKAIDSLYYNINYAQSIDYLLKCCKAWTKQYSVVSKLAQKYKPLSEFTDLSLLLHEIGLFLSILLDAFIVQGVAARKTLNKFEEEWHTLCAKAEIIGGEAYLTSIAPLNQLFTKQNHIQNT